MKTVNITLEIEESQVLNFEYWLRDQLKVISFRIVPDTNELYENDAYFRNIVKNVKKATEIRDIYINENNKNE